MASDLTNKKVAVYARFSTDMQNPASIDDQLRRCREHVERLGGTVPDGLVFSDAAMSGTSMARPGLEALLALATKKKPDIDIIVVEDVSRLSRDIADSATIFRRLEYAGVALIGLNDGVNTATKGAKLLYTLRSAMNEAYIDELRERTLRGLEGRALAGYATGCVPYGYRTVPEHGPDGRVLGNRIEIDEPQAKVVQRIFAEYLAGRSLAMIAITLNREGVDPPRANTKHRRKGWADSGIRSFLHNEVYTGRWAFKKRRWQKVPGTNRRVPRDRDPSEVMTFERPNLRIIDDETWLEVKERLAAVYAHYTRHADGAPKGRAAGGRRSYLFSGLLDCGACGAPMVIYGGSSSSYYRCSVQLRRGTCTNSLSVREDVLRPRILEALHDLLTSPRRLDYLRHQVVAEMSQSRRLRDQEFAERTARLRRVEDKIRGLIDFIAQGERSPYILDTLRDHEAQAKVEKEAIAALEREADQPIRLPSPDELRAQMGQLEELLQQDALAAREALRVLFKGGTIRLEPQADRVYLAKSEVAASPKRPTPASQGL